METTEKPTYNLQFIVQQLSIWKIPITIVPMIIGALEFIYLYMVEIYRTLIPLLQKTVLLGTAIILAKVIFN